MGWRVVVKVTLAAKPPLTAPRWPMLLIASKVPPQSFPNNVDAVFRYRNEVVPLEHTWAVPHSLGTGHLAENTENSRVGDLAG